MNASLVRAIRGPILLVTLGTLLSIDHLGPVGFGRTWPVLVIVFGVMKLLERGGEPPAVPPVPPPVTTGGNLS